MRWKVKKRHIIKEFEKRTTTKFLFFPKTIKDEYRWLERTSYIEQVIFQEEFDCMCGWITKKVWIPVEWKNVE